MSDLIRRSDVLQAIADYEFPWCKDTEPVHLVYGMGTAMKIVEKIPAVDAVEVVRCRECEFSRELDKYEKKLYLDSCVGCTKHSTSYHSVIMEGTDFCSYGERRDDNDY